MNSKCLAAVGDGRAGLGLPAPGFQPSGPFALGWALDGSGTLCHLGLVGPPGPGGRGTQGAGRGLQTAQ